MPSLTEITSRASLVSLVASLPPSALLVLYFYTPWTTFSTPMTNFMTELASQCLATAATTISFASINAKELLDVAKEYGISTAPSVVYIRGGQRLQIIQGSQPNSVRDALNRHAGASVVTLTTIKAPLSKPSEKITARLARLVKAAPIMLFMKGTPDSPLCRFSRRMVSILRDHNISYNYFDVLSDEDVRNHLKDFADWPTYPQLWIDGELIGGLDIICEELSADPGFSTKFLRHKTRLGLATDKSATTLLSGS